MSSSPSPTWYDVLGVPRDATADEIKAAWRAATDRFEPGVGSGGQFRMFNEAADVLLDPTSRAAYDETLAAEQPVASEPATTAEPVAPATAAPDEEPAPDSAPDPAPAVTRKPAARTPASRTAWIVAVVLALLTVAALVVAGIFALKVRDDARVADARDQAPASAERAAKALLAYDYRNLPADRKRASGYLTDGFRPKYLKNFALLEKQKDGTPGAAVQTKTIVTASVLGSGVMDAEQSRVRVLVYVNQVSKKPGKDPQIFQNRVAMTMEKDGGRWLVDDLKSY